MAPYQLLPGTKFSDILVPTIDTTRCMHVIGMMVEAKTPVELSILTLFSVYFTFSIFNVL